MFCELGVKIEALSKMCSFQLIGSFDLQVSVKVLEYLEPQDMKVAFLESEVDFLRFLNRDYSLRSEFICIVKIWAEIKRCSFRIVLNRY